MHPHPPRRSRLNRVLLPGALVVLALSVLGLVLLGTGSGFQEGDCIARTADGAVQVVPCSSAVAAYRVVGVLDDVRLSQSQPACAAAFPGSTASYFASEVTVEPGQVLCLVATA